LFAESLSGLLEDHGYQVIDVRPYDAAVAAFVAGQQPPIVILDVHGVPPEATSTLLDCAPNISVVHVSLDSSVIAMYQRRESIATVQDFLDLLALKEAGPDAPAPGPDKDALGAKI
jgi:hypothetical protein